MKKYTAKENEDLGSIAAKFGMPSWKYLYQINKDKIGDNPDLLKEGTVLEIPQWDSTSGDEKIKAKDADPFKYTGGLRYAYPWVPVSITLVDNQKKPLVAFEDEREYKIMQRKTNVVFKEGTLKSSDEIELLVPDSADIVFGIKGLPLYINGKMHAHPSDQETDGADAITETEDDDI